MKVRYAVVVLVLLGMLMLPGSLFMLPGVSQEAALIPVNISETIGASHNPAIALLGNELIVVWQEDNQASGKPDIFFRKATFSIDPTLGVTITPSADAAKAIASTPGSSVDPDIFVVRNRVFVVWSDDTKAAPTNPEGDEEIFLAYSDAGGPFNCPGLLSCPVNLSNNTGSSKQPSISGNEMKVVVVWSDDQQDLMNAETRDFEILVKESTDDGISFSAALNVSDDEGRNSANPKVAVDEEGNVFICWEQGSPAEIVFKQSTAFFPSLNLSNSPRSDSRTPAIGVIRSRSDELTKVHVRWAESGTTEINLTEANNAGGALSLPDFSDPYPIFYSANIGSRAPAIALDREGNQFTVWEEDEGAYGGKPDIRLRDSRRPVELPLNVSNSPGVASRVPDIAIAMDGANKIAFVVWEEDDPQDKPEIYVAAVDLEQMGMDARPPAQP